MAEEHVTLRDHVEGLFKGHERRHDEMEAHRVELRDLLQRALDAVAESLKEYKNSSNEWRGALNDLIANHPNRIELTGMVDKFDLALSTLGQKVEELKSANLLQTGAKERGTDLRVAFVAFGGLVLITAGLIISAVVAFR